LRNDIEEVSMPGASVSVRAWLCVFASTLFLAACFSDGGGNGYPPVTLPDSGPPILVAAPTSVTVDPSGKFVYVVNSGFDSVFASRPAPVE
jgi:DNA-binding beta-propeller fold protein YncE